MIYNFCDPTFINVDYHSGKPLHRVDNITCHMIKLNDWGSGYLVQFGNYNIVIDIGGGSSWGTTPIEPEVYNYLNWIGVAEIDLLIITHPHPDHIGARYDGGFQLFLDNFQIKEVWSTGHPFPLWYDGETPCPYAPPERLEVTHRAYENMLNGLFPQGYNIHEAGTVPGITGESSVPYFEPRCGYTRQIGDLTIKVVHPGNNLTTPYLNDDSLVMQFTWGNNKFLFVGDAGVTANRVILNKVANGEIDAEDIQADVLQIGHHGNDDAVTADFLDAVNPSMAHLQRTGAMDPTIRNLIEERKITLYNSGEEKAEVVFVGTKSGVRVVTSKNKKEYSFVSPQLKSATKLTQ